MPKHHLTRVFDAVMPRYAADFQCTGSACQDTCCAGWKITVDAPTLKAYGGVTHPQLTDRLKRCVTPVPKQERRAGGDPARLELDPASQCCAFLEQGLCAIHRDLGEDYLSNTCWSFPRHARDLAGQVEYVLDLGCPEAARKALLAENALELIESPVTLRPVALAKLVPQAGLSPLQVNEIRGFCFQLMQIGDLLPWQRLVLVGHLCHQLDLLIGKRASLDIDAFLGDFVQQVESGSMLEKLASSTGSFGQQAPLFFKLWQGQAERKNSSIQELIQKAVATGLGVDSIRTEQPDWGVVIRHYGAGLTRLDDALGHAPSLLDNWLRNEMFRETFPFGAASPYRHFLGLIARFGLLRLMLAGVCNAGGETDAAMLVRTTQVCSRLYPNPSFSTKAAQALSVLGFDEPQRFAELLRT